MTADGYLLDRCPPWCVEQVHETNFVDNIKVHQAMAAAFHPASGAAPVTVTIEQSEGLEDGVAEISPVYLMLYAPGADLTAAEARQVAALLLDQADKLDQICSG